MSSKTKLKQITLALAGGVVAWAGHFGLAQAQGLFDPVAHVEQLVVTEYEVQQRSLFLQLLNAPGRSRPEVIQALIQDRLRTIETQQVGAILSDEGLQEGLTEFAGRANLSLEEFTEALQLSLIHI